MKSTIVSRDSATHLDILGIDHLILLTGADSGGAWALIEVVVPPGAGIPPHVHTREDEVFSVLSGALEMSIGERRHIVPAGTTVVAPRDVPHSFRAAGEEARVHVAIYPAGIESMFTELAALPKPVDMAQVSAIVARYGIRFT
ncbi:MAG: hypothetical protein CHACPFDD_00215 [Phycisphaerae bacterium]|nr:hypothetical protein [Phycisphaerae bacterium]